MKNSMLIVSAAILTASCGGVTDDIDLDENYFQTASLEESHLTDLKGQTVSQALFESATSDEETKKAAARKPSSDHNPSNSRKPYVGGKPTVDPEPIVVTEPTVTPEPIVVSEPTVTPEPIVVTDPIVTPEPIVVTDPIVTPELIVVTESTVVTEPTDEPELKAALEPSTDTDTSSSFESPTSVTQQFSYISNNQWITYKGSNNVTYGDHSADAGFVNSRPGDFDSMRVRMEYNTNLGTGTNFLFPDKTREAWISYCMRFAPNWTTTVAGKLPGFAGNTSAEFGGQGGSPALGNNSWSARGMYGAYRSDTQDIPLGQYVYHSEQSKVTQYGDSDWWAPAPQYSVSYSKSANHNRWYAVTQHLRLNTSGIKDGLIEAWVDGVHVYTKSNLHFTDNEDFREIYRFWVNVYHGGSAKSPRNMYAYFDQFNYSIGSENKTSVECIN